MLKTLLIDVMPIVFRSHFATPTLARTDGVATGGVFGFTKQLIKLMKEFEPNYVGTFPRSAGTALWLYAFS